MYSFRGYPYISAELKFILLVGRGLNIDTIPHLDPSNNLLANEVPDLNLEVVGVLVLLDIYVDGETRA
jgi:hypothetical protein